MCILTDIIPRQAKRYGNRLALAFVDETGTRLAQVSYNELARRVENAALGLMKLGLKPGDAVLIFSPNRPQMLATDFACYHNRAVPVSAYATSSTEQVLYIARDCKPRFIIAGGAEQLKKVQKVAKQCPWVEQVISYDDLDGAFAWSEVLSMGDGADAAERAELEKRRTECLPTDTATLIYTSGTTGDPKGVDLPHSCFTAALAMHKLRLLMLSDKDTSLCFLPLCHIFEKAWSYYCLDLGIQIFINRNTKEIAGTLAHVRPTCMCSVPRFWEKVYAGVQEKISEMPKAMQRAVAIALKIGRKRNLDYVRLGKKAPWWLEKLYQVADKKVFHMVKRTVGIDHGNIFPTAGAPVADYIVDFFRSIGVPMVVGYGLSETTATVTCFPDVDYVVGSVGTMMPYVQVRISESGEVEVFGPTVMRGYYNNPKANAEAFTADGWFRTGDAGYFDKEGALVLTERIKDLFKTSNGKYVAPQAIESRLGGDKYIDQVAVIGDSRKYITAIIVPAFGPLKDYAAKKGIKYDSIEELVTNPEVITMLQGRIDHLQAELPSFEQIKKFTLLPKPFTMESGELTNTLKVRRPVIAQRYAKEIESMY